MRNRNWLIIGLIASLAANLALTGYVAGRMSQPGPVPTLLDPSLSLFRVVRDLPEARRDEFRPTMRAHYRSLRGDIRRMRSAQRGINHALAAEPFEPESLDRALHDFRTALLDGQVENHEVLVEVAGSMTAEERHRLLEAMQRPRTSKFHGPRRPERDGGRPHPQ